MIKLKDLISEGGKPRAGDYVRDKRTKELGKVNKIRGNRMAYVKFPSNKKSFLPMDISKWKLSGNHNVGRPIWTEGKLTEGVKLGDVREELEYAYEWDYVEQEGADSVRFDWGRGRKSMWVHKNGKSSGEIPKDNYLKKAMKKLGIK